MTESNSLMATFGQILYRLFPWMFPDRKEIDDLKKQFDELQETTSIVVREHAKEITVLIGLLDKRTQQISRLTQKIVSCEKQIEELAELSVTDPLTGLLSRRGMFSRFHGQVSARIKSKEAETAQVSFPRVSVLFIDVDRFKSVNDTLGHEGGDSVLVALADVMRMSFRSEDILCRMSGDEFLVIMPRTDTDQAYKKAAKFQQTLNADERMAPRGNRVTISIGVAELDFSFFDVDQALTEAMRLADQAMYHAKDKGRNMIVHLSDQGSAGG